VLRLALVPLDVAGIGLPDTVGDLFGTHQVTNRGLLSGEVEAIEAHDLVPGGDEVTDERLPRVVAGVHLSDRA
jgi:hypothetical protein